MLNWSDCTLGDDPVCIWEDISSRAVTGMCWDVGGRADWQTQQRVLGDSKIGFADTYDSSDLLGEVYEYFLGQFASAEGKKGGQFYTPSHIVRTLVAVLSPNSGRVYDPCCGSGGMFVQSEEFIKAHGGRVDDISIYGQESNPTTWRLAAMNLAVRRFAVDLGQEPGDTFAHDQFPDLKFDDIMANPPFNISDWGGEKYEDIAGFCKSASLEEIKRHGFVLTPGRVGASEDDECIENTLGGLRVD